MKKQSKSNTVNHQVQASEALDELNDVVVSVDELTEEDLEGVSGAWRDVGTTKGGGRSNRFN